MASLPKVGLPKLPRTRLDPAIRAPLISAVFGIAAASGLSVVLPPGLALPAAVAVMGLASLSALLALDLRRRQQAEALAASVGELNVRLAATRIKLDGLRARIDSEPLREADIAPTRVSLAELTAEVGLLGGVLRDVANAVSDHEAKLAKVEAQAGGASAAGPSGVPDAKPDAIAAEPAAALTAEPAAQVDANFRRRDEGRLAAILSAFAGGGIEVHLQPIVVLPLRRTVGYEALARLKLADGTVLMPAEFIAALERAGHGAGLDAQVLTQVLAIAGHVNARAQDHFITLNLSGGTWSDSRALGSIARVLDAFRAQAQRLVIEVPQRTWRTLDPARLGIIGGMAANGVRFALDQVSDLRLDPAGLADRGVRFVKAPALLLAGMGERPAGLDIDIADLAPLLRRAGIELVGERAETDRLVADLIDIDVRLAQGFAISQPRPVKPDVFQPVAAAEPEAPQSQPAPGSAVAPAARAPAARRPDEPAPLLPPAPSNTDQPARVPFRAVLRRA